MEPVFWNRFLICQRTQQVNAKSIIDGTLTARCRRPSDERRARDIPLLILVCAIVTALNPRFLSAANLQNTARLIGAFGIFSLGLGLVIITGGIDLSVGSAFALLGVLMSVTLPAPALPTVRRLCVDSAAVLAV